MRNAGVRFPWAAASSRPLAHFLILRKGIFTMQAKKTNPEKTKNPEMLTLDSTYITNQDLKRHISNIATTKNEIT